MSAEHRVTAGAVFGAKSAFISSNGAEAKTWQLAGAVEEIDALIDARIIDDVQRAIKHALETIHEVTDACSSERREWSQAEWSADDLGLWRGLIGARNAAHHSASQVVERWTHGDHDERVRWDIRPSALQELRSPDRRREYEVRVAGQAALPQLRRIVALMKAAIPTEE